MRRVAIASGLGLAFAGLATGTARAEPAGIDRIRAAFAEVQQGLVAKKFQARTFTASAFVEEFASSEGDSATLHCDGAEPRKLTVSRFGEMGKVVEEFYLDGGKVVFLLRTQSAYRAPLTTTGAAITVDRSYYVEGRLVRHIVGNQKPVDAISPQLNNMAAHRFDAAMKLLAAQPCQAKPLP